MRSIVILAAVGGLSVAAAVWAQPKPAGPAQPKIFAPAKGTAPSASQPAGTKPLASGTKSQPTKPTLHAEDEQAIRETVEAMIKAYNAGDAKAVAALFAPEAIIVDEEGHTSQGREEIQRSFAGIFTDHPESQMRVSISSIRFVTPGVAIEEGTSTLAHSADESPVRSAYSVVHVKQQDGKWKMASARDLADEAGTAESELDQLSWLVGEWIDESPDGLLRTVYGWTDDHVYIVGEFKLQIGGQTALSGTQRMCWDPLANKVRSWIFDSQGGFSEGLWTRRGNQWIVKLCGVTRDGRAGSATHVISRLSADKYSWQSRDRVVGDDITPDTEEIVVVKRPPGPESKQLPAK